MTLRRPPGRLVLPLFIAWVVMCWGAGSDARAEILLPYVFSDGAVLQRDARVAIWGSASPGALISVRLAASTAEARAGADGKWSTSLPPMPAAATPADLTIGSSDPKDAPRTLANVLVGDVWLCGGQSNMFWPLGKTGEFPGVDEGEAAIASPPDPLLRLLCDDKHPLWKNRGWQASAPDARRPFSGVAYFFGERLRRELKVPIGLISISRGGTPVQRWTPPAYAELVPLTRRFNALFARERARIDEYNRQWAAHNKVVRGGPGPPSTAPAPLPADLMIARSFSGAGAYEKFITPIIPYTLCGVIWYQGESNSGELEVARAYGDMFKALVDGWRDAWGAPDLPFVFVQLPCWTPGKHWPWTRQAQLVASRSIPRCDMIVSVDIGDDADVANLHPPKKRPIGQRLAAAALARVHGRPITWAGPTVSHVSSEAGKVILTFDPAGGTPRAGGGGDAWRDVEVAGVDGIFHPATVTLSGNRATAQSTAVADPRAIRYGWRPVFKPTLFNEDGLPASGFQYVVDGSGRWSLYVP